MPPSNPCSSDSCHATGNALRRRSSFLPLGGLEKDTEGVTRHTRDFLYILRRFCQDLTRIRGTTRMHKYRADKNPEKRENANLQRGGESFESVAARLAPFSHLLARRKVLKVISKRDSRSSSNFLSLHLIFRCIDSSD